MAKTILIAEDDPTTSLYVKKKLERVGYNIFLAANGREALNIIRVQEIDCIVLDVIMPVMDGVDLYKELKSHLSTASIPVVVITSDEVFKKSFHILGVEKFVAKPLDGDELLSTIELVFSSEQAKAKRIKALILCEERQVTGDMSELLEEKKCIVKVEPEGLEFVSDALAMHPDLIFIDLNTRGYNPVEIVKALKCFNVLQPAKILVFTYFTPEQMTDVEATSQLTNVKQACLDAGARKYIGRFSKVTFIDSIHHYL